VPRALYCAHSEAGFTSSGPEPTTDRLGLAHHVQITDSDAQKGSYIPQAVFNSDGSGSADFNDPSTSDYGKVDKG